MKNSPKRLPWLRFGGEPLASLAVAAIVALLVWLTSSTGWLQVFELQFHDWFVAKRARWAAWKNPDSTHDPRIVIVAVTGADLKSLDYPLTDADLARLLEQICADQPRAVGIDLYRDLPVPRSGEGTSAFHAAFQKHPEIVAIFLLGPERIAAPAFLPMDGGQVAFNDFPFDGRIVRRSLLYTDEGENTWYSLSARLADLYLQKESPPRTFGDAEGHPGWVSLGGVSIPRFEHTDGAYVRADDRGYQYFLDFSGPGPGQFTTYSVSDTLHGRVPKDAFRDKIVLIGMGDRSLNDNCLIPLQPPGEGDMTQVSSNNRPAPLDRLPRLQTPGEIFGVELHAIAINQLLRLVLEGGKAQRSWSSGGEAAWLALAALLGGLTGLVIRCPWRLLGALLLLTALATGAGFLLFANGLWVPVAAPISAALLSAVLVNTREGGRETRERRQLMTLFARNLSPAVAETLWEQRAAFAANSRPKPQELTVTVLFTDLAGFSTLAEDMPPPQVMDWLNEYLEHMAQQVEANGGVVLKYIGDALLAVFGAPLPSTSTEAIARDAANAVRSALAMQSALAALNAQWTQAGRQCAQMRVGIFTGPVVAGCLGSSSRLEYTVIGDSVNTASRLESWDKDYADPEHPVGDCRILIGESTQALVDHLFRTKRVGEIKLKGKQQPTIIHRILGSL